MIERRTATEVFAYVQGYAAGADHVLKALRAGTDRAVVESHVDATKDLMRTAYEGVTKESHDPS